MQLPPPPMCTWDDAEDLLLTGARADLDAGYTPLPTIAAFDGDEAVAYGVLRPLDERGPVPALVEVMALLLPCGVDRVALLLPGRAWSVDDPVPPVCEDGDLRARVVVLLQADGATAPCRPRTRLLSVEPAPGHGQWDLVEAPVDSSEVEAPLVDAVRILLEGRDEMITGTDGYDLVAQLGRVLLLGHELALSPRLADRLTLASAV